MDEIAQFKQQINLSEYAAAHGFQLVVKKSTAASLFMEHPASGEKIVISQKGSHWVFFSISDSRHQGTIIDFCQMLGVHNLGEIRKTLRPWLGTTKPIQVPITHFRPSLLPSDDAPTSAFLEEWARTLVLEGGSEYMQHRQIPQLVYESERFAQTIHIETRYGNLLFPHRNLEGEVIGFEKRGFGFKGMGKGGRRGLWRSQSFPTDQRIVIGESAIELLSFHCLKIFGDSSWYLSTAGSFGESSLTATLLVNSIYALPDAEVVLAFNNDPGGVALDHKVRDILKNAGIFGKIQSLRPPHCNDWNEELRRK